MICTDGLSERVEMGGQWVRGGLEHFASRPEFDVSDYMPLHEQQTIGRLEIRDISRGLRQVTMYKSTTIPFDSEFVMQWCQKWAYMWRGNDCSMAGAPVAHAGLRQQILNLLKVYGTHVVVHHVPAGLVGSERGDKWGMSRG